MSGQVRENLSQEMTLITEQWVWGVEEVEGRVFQVGATECVKTKGGKKKKKMKCIWWNDGSVYEYKGGVEWYECKAGDLRLCHKVMRKLLNIIEQGSETNLQKQFWI